MPTMKYFNPQTSQWERADAGSIRDDSQKITPSDIKQFRQNVVHSGFLNFDGMNDITLMPTTANQLKIAKDLRVVVNGYILVIPSGTVITLPTPDTFGTREDLVFAEFWQSKIGTWNWRIRTVAGVDFKNNTLDGFTKSDGWWVDSSAIIAQGSNATEPTRDSNNKNYNWFRKGTLSYGSTWKVFDDYGLYVAGDGSSTAKSILQTADGYSYAIPMFRVKRRNSGGYKVNNLNGARDYVVRVNSGTTYYNGNGYFYNFSSDLSSVVIGDSINWSRDGKNYIITKVDNTNKYIYIDESKGTPMVGNGWSYSIFSSSDRPDKKYSNIIDATDIIDLRHKVTLTDYNYRELLDMNFDKLLRGQLQTKDKPIMVKERFNLQKAPLGMPIQLMPVSVKGNDGVSRDLVNLLGTDGNCEDTNKWVTQSATALLDSSNVKYGINSIKVTSTGGYVNLRKNNIISIINVNKYYLFIAEFKNSNFVNGMQIGVFPTGGTNRLSTAITDSSKFNTSYVKVSPAHLNGATNVEFDAVYSNNAPNGQYGYVDGIRIYEIDQATYDKIDVDAEFTGDKLAQKFPYVSSYPNVVENLFDKNAITNVGSRVNETTGTAYTTSAPSGMQYAISDYIPITSSSSYVRTPLGNNATGSYAYYDSSKTFISGSSYATNDMFTSIPLNAVFIRLTVNANSLDNYVFAKGSTILVYSPFGRYYLPTDYATGETKADITRLTQSNKNTISDAQTSENITEIIESLRTPQKHIKVTQATEGQWNVNDTIQINSNDGVITGVIDNDTALAKVAQPASGANMIIYLDDVSKFAVNDTIKIWRFIDNSISPEYVITAIDLTNKTITTNSPNTSYNIGDMIVETTTSTSSPVATATGLVGTWSGLGTKQATFTITTKPTTNTDSIKLQYSINYPARKGLSVLPSETLEARVNGEKLIKSSDGIVKVKANFVGKVSGNTDLIPHIMKYDAGSSLIIPSVMRFEGNQSYYNLVMKQDNSPFGNALGNGSINSQSQALFSFDLIRLMTDKFGESFFSDCVTTADKVNKLKNTLTKIQADWWGYGSTVLSNPTGTTDFAGKVAGSVTENANKVFYGNVGTGSLTLQAPSSANIGEGAQTQINGITSLDGSTFSFNRTSNGEMAQTIFSFNLIEYVKRKYNFTPDVAWLKANVNTLSFNWWGFGSSPTGSKATMTRWKTDTSTWDSTYAVSHLNNTVTKLNFSLGNASMSSSIDTNGFVHFLAYADPSNGTTASVINTDYVSLDVTLNAGSNKASLQRWENGAWTNSIVSVHTNNSVTKLSQAGTTTIGQMVQSDGFAHFLAYADASNGVNPSTINTDYIELTVETNVAETGYDVLIPENQYPVLVDNYSQFNDGDNMIPPFTDVRWSINANAQVVDDNTLVLNATGNYQDSPLSVDVLPNTTYTISWVTMENSWGLNFLNGGTYISGSYRTEKIYTFTTPNNTNKISIYPSSGTKTGTFTFKNPMLTIGSQAKAYVPYAKTFKRKKLLDFRGKVAGSTFENPHQYTGIASNVFTTNPMSSVGTGSKVQSIYDNISKLDGVLNNSVFATTIGQYAQHLFEFDLSHLGMSLSELKSALRKITVNWKGYGVGDNAGVQTYGASIKTWYASGSWQPSDGSWNNTTSSPSTITKILSIGSCITNDQKIYILAYSTYPASGDPSTDPTKFKSEIYTDYISLTVELADYVDYVKSNAIKVKKETKEMKLVYPAKSNRLNSGVADSIELFYNTLPIQDLNVIGTAGEAGEVLAYGNGIVTSAKHNENIGLTVGATEYNNFIDRFNKFATMDFTNLGKAQPDTLLYALDTSGLNAYFGISGMAQGRRQIIGMSISSDTNNYFRSSGSPEYFGLPKEVRTEGLGFIIPFLVVTANNEIRLYVAYGKMHLSYQNLSTNSGEVLLASFAIDGKHLLKR